MSEPGRRTSRRLESGLGWPLQIVIYLGLVIERSWTGPLFYWLLFVDRSPDPPDSQPQQRPWQQGTKYNCHQQHHQQRHRGALCQSLGLVAHEAPAGNQGHLLLGGDSPSAKPLPLDLAPMAQVASVSATPPSQQRPRWQVPLLVGFCFGLGYGVTQRLLALQLPSLVRLGQGFEVRPFPGTSLESLRLRFGAENQDIRGDADLLQLEQQPDTAAPAAPAAKPPQELPSPAPEPELEAPPPPELPGADLPQSTPAAGPP